MKRWILGMLMGLIGLFGLSACQTQGEPTSVDESATAPEPAGPVEFTPVSPVATIEAQSGPYPDLYAGESYAVWVDPDVAEVKREAALKDGQILRPNLVRDVEDILRNFIVIECHMASTFSDMDQAYDAVAFRHVDARLELPDGESIEPVQVVPGDLQTEEAGALRRFSRTNLVVFPRRDLMQGTPALPPNAPSIKLVLEADNANTVFAFEWPGAPSGQPPAADEWRKRAELVKLEYQKVFQKVRRLAHIFD